MRSTEHARRSAGTGENSAGLSVPAFVGREKELATAAAALGRPPAVVLVEGEAGIGKSRLVQELLAAGSPRALVAVCPPYRQALTLGPVVDAVRAARNRVDGLRLSPLAGALRPLFPEWAADLPPAPDPLDEASAARHRLFRALAELVDRCRVGLLVVEDAHLADEATLEFLLFLVSRPRPVSLLVTYRPEEVPDGSLLLRLAARVPTGTTPARLTLPPLDLAAATGLVSSMLDGGQVTEEFAAFLHERTDGIPLALEESVRLLRDREDLVCLDGEWLRRSVDDLQVPPTVRDAVRERLQRLGPAARRILDSAAVLAEPATETLLGTVADLPGDQARAGLAESLAAGLLAEVGRRQFYFRHALIGRAVYETAPRLVTRGLHLAAGRALEDTRPVPAVQLARHFREADDVDSWARYADLAADRAVASNDHAAAVQLLNDLLAADELPARMRGWLASKLARAALFRREAGDPTRDAIPTLRSVLGADGLNPSARAEIRNHLGRLLMQAGEWEEGYRELERAIPDLGPDPAETAWVMTLLGFPLASPWPVSVHLRWLRRAAALTPRVTSAAARLSLTADRAAAMLLLGEAEGWAVAAQLPGGATSVEERIQAARGHFNVAACALAWGRYPEASRHLAAAKGLASADQYGRLHSNLMVVQAYLDWFAGDWHDLAERCAAVIEAADTEHLPRLAAGRLTGLLRAARGAPGPADQQLSEVLHEVRQLGVLDLDMEPSAEIGRLRLAEERIAEALDVTAYFMQTIMTKQSWIWATEIAPVRVEALVAAGRVEEAGQLVAAFGRGLRGRDAPAPRAALATCRALLAEAGDQERAVAAFARAARAWDGLPRPYDALLARERQGRCLLACGRADAGLAVLSEVSQGLIDLGARGDADRVAYELRRHGRKAPRPWRGGRHGYGDQLSPRELEIARLVIAGKTNAQIARVLSKSQRTVSTQLHSAMRKLDASSRTALAVKAIEVGLVRDEGMDVTVR